MRADPFGLPEPPWIVGHRGTAGEAAENTVESLELAIEQRADMVELDLQLTADGSLVAFHDWDLRRLAGVSMVVESSPLDRLRESGLPLPTLEQVLGALPGEQPLNLELKRRRTDPGALARRLAAAIEGRDRLLISSFDWSLLEAVRELLPERPLAPIARLRSPPLLAAAERLGAWSVHCHRRLVSARLATAARESGRPLLAFTVNDVAEARRFLELGISGLFTDHPGRLRRELAAP